MYVIVNRNISKIRKLKVKQVSIVTGIINLVNTWRRKWLHHSMCGSSEKWQEIVQVSSQIKVR